MVCEVHLYFNGGFLEGQRKLYPKPEFHPQYLEHIGNKKAINAILEIRELWKYVAMEAFHNYSHMYSHLVYPLSNGLKISCQKDKEKFAVYDRISKEWHVAPSEPTYEYCYNGKDFLNFDKAKSLTEGCRLLLVGKFTSMMQEPNLYTNTEVSSASFREFIMPSMELTVGVPGCGKTSHIINNHSPGSLVLTSCKEGAEDIRKRMAEKNGSNSNHHSIRPNYNRSYRTIDSYLINSRDRYLDVWIDEALMEHPGKLFLVCLFTRCKRLHMLGDPNQLGYINRTDVELLCDKSSMFFKPTGILNVSYRCPVDVMAILSTNYDYYKERVYSASNVWRSLECKKFTSLGDVPNSEGTKYLVFKQAEKKRMKEAGYDVSTVHEYQGKEAKRVVLVKTSRNAGESQCESAPHLLVAMSRHRESLVYYTPVRDRLKKLMETHLTDAELQRYHESYLTPAQEFTDARYMLSTELRSYQISTLPPYLTLTNGILTKVFEVIRFACHGFTRIINWLMAWDSWE